MDWALAIDRNRNQLLRIIAALFALAGLAEGGMVEILPRPIYRAVLLVLRPAESAVRRLVVIAARGHVLSPRPVRAVLARLILLSRKGKAHSGKVPVPAFPLIDPLKRFVFTPPRPLVRSIPRISVPGLFDPVFLPERPVPGKDLIKAQSLCRRLLALKLVLDDLPRQAHRLARWRARQDLARASETKFRPGCLSPFRPGRPPGLRKRAIHEIDAVLRVCHGLALNACTKPNSS